MFIIGSASSIFVAFYPSGESGPDMLGAVNLRPRGHRAVPRCRQPREESSRVAGCPLIYYFALIMPGIGGVVSGIPGAYWLTPLLVAAFVAGSDVTSGWFLRTSELMVRILIGLSLLAGVVVPEEAYTQMSLVWCLASPVWKASRSTPTSSASSRRWGLSLNSRTLRGSAPFGARDGGRGRPRPDHASIQPRFLPPRRASLPAVWLPHCSLCRWCSASRKPRFARSALRRPR